MGQEINPHDFRAGAIKDWGSRWFAKNNAFGDTLVEDHKLRKTPKRQLASVGVPRAEIEHDASRVRVHIYYTKSGMIIGKGGAEIEKLHVQCEAMLGKPVSINIIEMKPPDLNAQLIAEDIAQRLEKGISLRHAMKQCMGRAMKLSAKGIKTQASDRLGGAEIAHTEHCHESTIPLQTIRADTGYGFAEAITTYGRIGVKMWIYRDEVLHDNHKPRREGGNK